MALTATNKADQQDSRYLSTPAEVERCFKSFRDQRTTLFLTLDGTHEQVTCQVLDVTPAGILIEDIKPRSALALLRQKPRFSISVRNQGAYAFVEKSGISAEGAERGLPFFTVPLPTTMLYQQRRRAARYRLPMRVTSAGANITLFGNEHWIGKIIDISAGGCRAAFQLPEQVKLKVDELYKDCAINLPPVLEIHSHGCIRHSHIQRDGTTIVGIELTEMHVTDRRRLEQFIQSLARQSS